MSKAKTPCVIMQRRLLLGIIIFGIGGSLVSGSPYSVDVIVGAFFGNQFGLVSDIFSLEGVGLQAIFGFASYFLLGLGLCMIFKPLLTMSAGQISSVSDKKVKLRENKPGSRLEGSNNFRTRSFRKSLSV
jgi:hypothetical protein